MPCLYEEETTLNEEIDEYELKSKELSINIRNIEKSRAFSYSSFQERQILIPSKLKIDSSIIDSSQKLKKSLANRKEKNKIIKMEHKK